VVLRRVRELGLRGLTVLAIGGVSSVHAAPGEVYEEIKPILQKHCYECHGPEKMKGDLDLTTFSDYDKILEAKEAWQTVYERVQAFEIPPKGVLGCSGCRAGT